VKIEYQRLVLLNSPMQNPTRPPEGRMLAVQTPIIPVIAELIAQTPGTISLGQGVVYYGPPQSALDRLTTLNTANGIHKYGDTGGLKELRELITNKLLHENGINVANGSKVIVTAGSNMGFLNAMFAITCPGDEIILQVPYYFNHEMAVRMVDCTPVLVPTDENYQLRPDKIHRAITEKTRAVVTISPNNPSGVVYPAESLIAVNKICREHGLYHISDEAYEYFTYNGSRHFSPGSIRGAEMHTISLYSLSKAYGFASWRIGYMVIPEHLTGAVYKAQDTNLICPALPSQFAAAGALQTGVKYCRKKLQIIEEVRDIMLQQLRQVTDICQVSAGDGAFYLLLKVNTGMDDMTLATRLIREHQVAVIPGHTFGFNDGCYLRVAYGALDKNNATEGIRRLIIGLKSIIIRS
jgi:aspartate/methionine/tyrosine aminotransferase